MIFEAGINTINRQTAALLHLQQQVANGRRILTPSDDPVAAARALEVTQSRDVVAQFSVNHSNASSSLGLEEAQLSSSTDIIGRVRELAVQAGNTSLSDSDRQAIAFEMRARFNEMIGLANATDGNGQYLFAGFMGSTKPFGGTVENILAGNEITYSGDDGQRKLQISPSRAIEISDSGNDVFGRIRNGNGYFSTGYAAANTGGGIIDGGNVTDPAKWNALANKNYSISFSIDNTVVPPVTYYDILDNVGSSLLTGGAPGSGPAPLPAPTAASGLRVYNADLPIMLRSQGAEPVFDLGANLTMSGDPVSGDSFTIAPSTSQSLFKTIAKLVGTLENGSTGTLGNSAKLANDIGFALTNLDQSLDNVLRVRAAVGSRLGEIETTISVNADVDLQYQQTLSQLQDLDYAKTISDLTRKQTDLEAAQKSFAKTSQLSLFNYI
jgi:flagellar hook-associated protein 3 FlgL